MLKTAIINKEINYHSLTGGSEKTCMESECNSVEQRIFCIGESKPLRDKVWKLSVIKGSIFANGISWLVLCWFTNWNSNVI